MIKRTKSDDPTKNKHRGLAGLESGDTPRMKESAKIFCSLPFVYLSAFHILL